MVSTSFFTYRIILQILVTNIPVSNLRWLSGDSFDCLIKLAANSRTDFFSVHENRQSLTKFNKNYFKKSVSKIYQVDYLVQTKARDRLSSR